MNTSDVQLLYGYNRWANDRVLSAASRLTPEQFTRDLASSHRSVRDTLAHILSAEWIYLERWRGVSPRALLDPHAFPTVAALRTKWAAVERDQQAFIDRLTDEALRSVVAYLNTRGERWQYPLWHVMQHVVNHSSYHRGQVTTMLRQMGAEPVATDLLLFLDLTATPSGGAA